MVRDKWLWAVVVAVPVVVVGGLTYADAHKTKGYVCPLTGERLSCESCCPLNGRKPRAAADDGYTCPVTGEQLPCEKCCPLNGATSEQPQADGYVCPITGQTLPCENYCPLNT